MDRTTRVLFRYCKVGRISPVLLSSSLRYLGIQACGARALPLKVDAVDAHLQVSSSFPFDARQKNRLICTTCAVKNDSSFSLGFFYPRIHSVRRWLSTSSQMSQKINPEEMKKRMEDLTIRFAEARELLGDARESLGSTYFSEDMTEAQEAVSTAIATYEAFLADLDEDQRKDVIRTIGLRMEELKAQEQAIKDLLD